jgi:hypothetical protein
MRLAGLILVLAAAALLAGCPPKPGPHGPGGDQTGNNNTTVAAPAWPFWPSRMRLHPLTRLVMDEATGQRIIEARIEFFDPDGATTKAIGQLTLQLHRAEMIAIAPEPLQIWNQDLRDLALNRRQYDDVTRTYLFRLEIDSAIFPEQPELRAYFLAENGQQLEAAFKVK